MRAVIFLTMLLLAPMTTAADRFITVKGEGTVQVPPDYVSIEISIVAEGVDKPRLKQEVDDKAARILELTARLQIAGTDVKSTGVQVDRNYQQDKNDNEIFKGYIVTRDIEIRLRRTANYELLAQGLVDAGMDVVKDISVGVDDKPKMLHAALAAAAKDAQSKALAICTVLGVSVGTPIEIGEERLWHDKTLSQEVSGNYGEIVVTGSRLMPRAAPLLFAPHDITVNAEVWVRFSIAAPGAA